VTRYLIFTDTHPEGIIVNRQEYIREYLRARKLKLEFTGILVDEETIKQRSA
jgi:hypothetical protein